MCVSLGYFRTSSHSNSLPWFIALFAFLSLYKACIVYLGRLHKGNSSWMGEILGSSNYIFSWSHQIFSTHSWICWLCWPPNYFNTLLIFSIRIRYSVRRASPSLHSNLIHSPSNSLIRIFNTYAYFYNCYNTYLTGKMWNILPSSTFPTCCYSHNFKLCISGHDGH